MARRQVAKELIEGQGGSVEALVPESIEESRALRRLIPKQYHEHMDGYMAGEIELDRRLFAAVAASVLGQQELQPNSGFSMHPATLAFGATATPGTVYPLVPFKSGLAQPTFNFVEEQRFFGAMTGRIDSANGWHLVSGFPRFSIDAISGTNDGDLAFAAFATDVVLGRQLVGVYQRHRILESVPFLCAAILYGPAVQMFEGFMVEYWDERCLNKKIMSNFEVMGIQPFNELVEELMDEAGVEGVRPEHLIRRIRRRHHGSRPI